LGGSWILGKDESINAGEIRPDFDVLPVMGLEDFGDDGGLVLAEFEDELGVWVEEGEAGVDEAADDVEAVWAAVEGEEGIAADFAAEGGDFGTGDVGEVGDDEVEGAGDFFEEVAADEAGVGEREAGGVEAGEVESVFGDVSEDDFGAGFGPGVGEIEANAAAAAGHVEDTGGGCGTVGEFFAEVFGFGSGDEGAVVGDEFEVAKGDSAEEVLEGDAFGAAAGEVAEFGEIGFTEGFAKAEVEVESAAVEDVGEQVLHVEAGLFDSVLGEVTGAGLEGGEDGFGHGVR
jgi:hypothetical protein